MDRVSIQGVETGFMYWHELHDDDISMQLRDGGSSNASNARSPSLPPLPPSTSSNIGSDPPLQKKAKTSGLLAESPAPTPSATTAFMILQSPSPPEATTSSTDEQEDSTLAYTKLGSPNPNSDAPIVNKRVLWSALPLHEQQRRLLARSLFIQHLVATSSD